MLVGRIGNIKTVFLESKEISKLKDLSYAPLAKENVDSDNTYVFGDHYINDLVPAQNLNLKY